MCFSAYDVNTSDSNYFVNRDPPAGREMADNARERVELPPNSVTVPPVDIAYSEWMDSRLNSEVPIPKMRPPRTGFQFQPIPEPVAKPVEAMETEGE